jgi:uncharacterized coiled-coil DUF342 family protein
MKQQKNRQIPLFSSTTKDLSPEIQHIIIRRISEDLSSLKEELQNIVDSHIDEEIQSKKVEVDDCLSFLGLHLPELKNLRPDCSKYDGYTEMVRPHLDFVKKCRGEWNSYIGKLEGIMAKFNTMEERISKSSASLEFIDRLNEGSTSQGFKSLKQGFQDIGYKLKEYFSSFKKTKEVIDDLNRRLQLCEDELKGLMKPNHAWGEILTFLPYPTSKPDEFREVEKVVGRRCKRCGVEERY